MVGLQITPPRPWVQVFGGGPLTQARTHPPLPQAAVPATSTHLPTRSVNVQNETARYFTSKHGFILEQQRTATQD